MLKHKNNFNHSDIEIDDSLDKMSQSPFVLAKAEEARALIAKTGLLKNETSTKKATKTPATRTKRTTAISRNAQTGEIKLKTKK